MQLNTVHKYKHKIIQPFRNHIPEHTVDNFKNCIHSFTVYSN